MSAKKNPHIVKMLAENPAFEVGDVVRLVAGGPSMCIRQMTGDKILCEWFDKATTRSHTFLKAQLVHTNPSQVPVLNMEIIGTNKSEDDIPPWERK